MSETTHSFITIKNTLEVVPGHTDAARQNTRCAFYGYQGLSLCVTHHGNSYWSQSVHGDTFGREKSSYTDQMHTMVFNRIT